MQWLERTLLSLILLLLIGCFADWAIWQARGRPYASIVVTKMVVAPLKGNREEYYPDGSETLRCNQSLLPWNSTDSCWWLKRRHIVLER